jgi:hypothetical protein
LIWPLLQEIAGKPVAPSWGAWAGLVFGGGSFLILIFDRIVGRGKSLQGLDNKISDLCDRMEDVEETLKIMDSHQESLSTNVQALTHEWRGVDGKNGWKSIVRLLRHEVTEIQKRNLAIDAVSQYEQDQLRKHGKKPERLRDKIKPEDVDDN